MARATLTPVNHTAAGIVYPIAPAATADGTPWGAFTGVQFINSGSMYLWYYNGATATAANLLLGRSVEGFAYPATTDQVTIGATSYGAIGALSRLDFTQGDGSGMTYIDFTNMTTLFVRLYQLAPVQ
jgi:hypothetical protein